MKFLEELCEKMVNPPKIRYSPFDLGSPLTALGRRHDFTLRNARGSKLYASFYQSARGGCGVCVVYLHSMNGSRLESIAYAQEVLAMGLSFCSFDFAGCGNSEGATISFGANQKQDVAAVTAALETQMAVKRVVLWGRSMGAACALKYYQFQQTNQQGLPVSGLILDSCYRSFKQLAIEIGHRHSQIPQFLVKAGFFFIQGTLQEKGEFLTDELELQPIAAILDVPVLFLASREDVTVNCEHSQSLFAVCDHPRKKLRYIRGLHNESRDEAYIKEVRIFLEELSLQETRGEKRYRELRANKFERIMEKNRKNFVMEGDETEKQTDCSCSLFPSALPSLAESGLRSRKNSEPAREKMRLSKMVSPRQAKVRSSQQMASQGRF